MMVNTTDNNVQTPSVQEKVETNVNHDKQTQDASASTQTPSTPETEGDPNWRAFREARKKDRAEREAAERRAAEKEQEIAALKAAMEAAFSKNSPTPQAYQQYYGINQEQVEESEEQRIDKIVETKLAQREAAAERERLEREQREYPNRLLQTYPDFNHVISQENRDYLDYHYPEISRPLSRLPDNYDKWSDIYHAIKKFVPNNTNAKKEAARADINAIKPRSISMQGLTQSQPAPGSHILTEERKAANWARMQQTRKGVG